MGGVKIRFPCRLTDLRDWVDCCERLHKAHKMEMPSCPEVRQEVCRLNDMAGDGWKMTDVKFMLLNALLKAARCPPTVTQSVLELLMLGRENIQWIELNPEKQKLRLLPEHPDKALLN